MNKYNAEHYWDETAAIAISRADKARRRLKKEPIRRLAGLTYKIGEVVMLTWIDGVLMVGACDMARGRDKTGYWCQMDYDGGRT